MRVFELHDLRTGYVTLCDLLRHTGQLVSPRGYRTLEVEDAVITVEDLTDTLPVNIGRGVNLQFAALEALQLIAGMSTPELLVVTRPEFEQYLEPNGTQWGAYGPRTFSQVPNVVRKLQEDRDSRQAVVTLWNPQLDNEQGHRDYPCTVTLGFRIRKDQLNLSVTMRSNDVWLGTAYDVFQFTQLQWSIANELRIKPGTYTHTAWSFHLYERDWDKAEQLLDPPNEDHPAITGQDRHSARALLQRRAHGYCETPSDWWYLKQISRAWEAYDRRHGD